MYVNTKLNLISKFTVVLLAIFVAGCFFNTKIVGLEEQKKNASTSPETQNPSEVDFSIKDKPGTVHHQKMKLSSDGVSSTSDINSPDLTFSVKFVDISGAGDLKLVKTSFDGDPPTKWDLPFTMRSTSQVLFSKINPNSNGIAFISNAVDSTIYNLYYLDFNSGTTNCLSCPMVTNGWIHYNNGKDIQFVNNNTRVVFAGDVEVDGRVEIYSNNLNGTDRVKLNGTVSGTGTFSSYIVNPARDAIAFVGNHTASSPNQLHYVSTLGTGRTRISPNGVVNSSVSYNSSYYLFSLDGSKIVFTQDRDTLNKSEVFVSNIDGSNNIKLSSPITPAGGDVSVLAISPDGSKVIYVGDQDIDTATELYSVRLDGTGGYAKLSTPLVAGRRSIFYSFDPSGTQVLYGADPTTSGNFNLYSVNLDGTNTRLLVTGFGRHGGVYPNPSLFFINSSQFYFLGDFDFDFRYNLYRINLDGTGQTTIYTHGAGFTFPFESQISQMYDSITGKFYFSLAKVSPSSICKIKSIDLNGANERTLYDCDTGLPYLIGQQSIVSGNRIVYKTFDRSFSSTLDFASTTELYKGSTADFTGLSFSPDSKKLVGSFMLKDGNENGLRLSILDIATSSIVTPLPSAWGHGQPVQFSPNSQSMILGLFSVSPLDYIYKVGLDGTGLTNLTTSHGFEEIWDYDAKYSNDGQYIVYLADHGGDTDPEIISMRTDGSNWTMLHPVMTREAGKFEITPQSDKVIFTGERDSTVFELFSTNIDGTGHIKLNTPLIGTSDGIYDFNLSPNGNTVLYQAEQNTSGVRELYKVNKDGSGMQRLNPALSGSQSVTASEFTPDGSKVLLTAKIDSLSIDELYKVNIDGTGFVKISPPLAGAGGIDFYSGLFFTSDSNHVIYTAFASSSTRSDVYITNLNTLGSICVSCTLVGSNTKIGSFALSTSTDRVYFTYDSRGTDLYDLYSIKIDGTDLRQLNINVHTSKDKIISFKTVPGGVIYLHYKNGNAQLFKVNSDGTNHVRLHTELTGFKNASAQYLISPDNKKLIYFINESDPSYADMYITDL